jgi:hypothetical protein
VALVAAAMSLMLALAPVSCGSDEPDLTVEQHLSKLAGRELTRTEVNEQLELADLLCGFNRRLLERIWLQLDARQLEFQDFVFGEHCPERISSYTEFRPVAGTVPPGDRVTTTTSTSTSGSGNDEDDDSPSVTSRPTSSTDRSTSTTDSGGSTSSRSTSSTSTSTATTTSSSSRSS